MLTVTFLGGDLLLFFFFMLFEWLSTTVIRKVSTPFSVALCTLCPFTF